MDISGSDRCQEHGIYAKEIPRQLLEPVQMRGHVYCKWQAHRDGAAQVHWSHIVTPYVPNAGHEGIGRNVL
jgi:hypothetical protein